MPKDTAAVYLYCVVRASRAPAMGAVPGGLPGAFAPEVRQVNRSLWLVSARVPLDVYGPDHLEPRLRDRDWVSKVAVAHEAVVEHFARTRSTTVIPLKLFTMFSSIEKALDDVLARQGGIERAMRHISGAEEWGIRVLRAHAAGSSATSSTPA